MKTQKSILLLLLFSVLSLQGFAQEAAEEISNMERFGVLTLLPPVVAIVLAFISKNVVLSLFIGAMTGTIMLQLSGFNIFATLLFAFMAMVDHVLGSLADSWNAGIILQCLTIGGLIAVVSKMGGAKAIAESLAKRAKSPVSAQIYTWILGLLIFFDDYANALITGPIMRPVTDKMRISREKLSFIVDATAAPIAGIALISTWVAFEVGLIKDAYESIGLTVNAYGVFIETIPYRFYNILILAFIVISALTLKDFGPMYKAQKRAAETGETLRPGSVPMASSDSEIEPDEKTPLSIWNAIIPIGTLILGAFAGFYYNGWNAIMGGDDLQLMAAIESSPYSFMAVRETFGSSDASIVLFQAALLASIVAVTMAVTRKIMTLGEAVDIWVKGVKSLVITGVILLLAWSLSGIIKELETAKYLVSILSGTLPAFLLPAIIFIMGSVISFATGTSYGTMGILMPLAIPLAYAINPDPTYVVFAVSAVLTGAIFGDHCSPISDTTILSSMGSSVDHMDHVKTQIVYALVVGAITVLVGYIPIGLGLPILVVLPMSLAAVAAVIHIFGKKVY